MLLHRLRQLSLFGLPSLLSLILAISYFKPEVYPTLIDALFIIFLTANIGYFTNFIAIKMLFRPYVKSALGRQGLIPKNQPKLAKALSNTLSDHFLASEHWQEYLQDSEIVPKALGSLTSLSKEWLDKPDNQKTLQNALISLLESNTEDINQFLAHAQLSIVENINANLNVDQMLQQGFEWVENQFEENPQEMEFLIEPLVNTVAANIPLIASRLIEVVDDHIEKQDTIRRGVAKAAKWSANFSEEDIKDYLFRMVASREFRLTIFEGLQTLVAEYKNQTSSGHTNKQGVESILADFIERKVNAIDFSGAISRLLEKPETGKHLAKFLSLSMPVLAEQLGDLLSRPEIKENVDAQIIAFIEAIDLREIIEEKAAAFSPKTMENIFHNMIADQLVFIELLGALLGALSGLALVNISWFVGLSATALGYLVLDNWLTHQRESSNESNKAKSHISSL